MYRRASVFRSSMLLWPVSLNRFVICTHLARKVVMHTQLSELLIAVVDILNGNRMAEGVEEIESLNRLHTGVHVIHRNVMWAAFLQAIYHQHYYCPPAFRRASLHTPPSLRQAQRQAVARPPWLCSAVGR